MKKFIITIIVLSNFGFAQNWIQIEKKDIGYVEAINCKDSNNCFALTQKGGVEGGGRLYKSTDLGKTWALLYKSPTLFEQEDPIVINVNGCVNPNPDYYFISSDDNSVIQKSTDGGGTFKKILIDSSEYAEDWELDDLAMWDSSIGFVTNEYYFYTTKDGWATIQKHQKIHKNQTYYSPVFLDSNTVVMIYSSPWANSIDLGIAYVKYFINDDIWDTLTYFGKNQGHWFDAPESIYYVNDTLAFTAGWRRDNSFPVGEYYDIIYKSTNGGNEWNLIFSELNKPYKGFYDISFADDNNGIAVGYWGKIAMTNDGGDTWVYEPYPNEMKDCRKMLVTWAGHTPIIGTWDAGIFRYEGDFFNFPVGVEDQPAEKEISLYPNPVSDFLYIKNAAHSVHYEIISALGVKAGESEYTGKIDVSSLSSGIYFLRIGEKVSKFVKY